MSANKVGIVCDSTADLAPERIAELGVEMVPLTVFFGEEAFLDWTEIHPEEFYTKLASARTLPRTSQPSPAIFGETYRRLAEQGCTSIVSIHLSSSLSGTYESARIASLEAPVPVRLVDTRLASQATGLVVKAAAAERDAGGDADAIEARANEVAGKTRLYFVLDTLEYLVKGGRAGKAAGLAASLLNIKPVLTLEDGTVVPFRKVKGLHKAIDELARHVAEDSAANGRMRVALLHGCEPDRAQRLKQALDASGADYELDDIGLVGAVIGTYTGRGAVGLAYYPVG